MNMVDKTKDPWADSKADFGNLSERKTPVKTPAVAAKNPTPKPVNVRKGIISDIHGNMLALDAVLQDGKYRGVTEWYCLGDNVGYCGQTLEVQEMLRGLENLKGIVKGNHDEYAQVMRSGVNEQGLHDICGTNLSAGKSIGIASRQVQLYDIMFRIKNAVTGEKATREMIERGLKVDPVVAERIVQACGQENCYALLFKELMNLQKISREDTYKFASSMRKRLGIPEGKGEEKMNDLEKWLYELPAEVQISSIAKGLHGFKEKDGKMKYIIPKEFAKAYGITNEEVFKDPETVIKESNLFNGIYTLAFTGHVHVPFAFAVDDQGHIYKTWNPERKEGGLDYWKLRPGEKVIINVGSVGISRRQDFDFLEKAEAAGMFVLPAYYAIYDEKDGKIEFCEIYYDYRKVERDTKIVEMPDKFRRKKAA